jgi:predicted ATPase/DNA-binding CsgD family transcriptional regulator/DNA-binding XRE family transcriptional regulator
VQGEAASFGEQLRRCRERAALSQAELAAQAGLTVHAISALERGLRRRPYPHTVQTLATALGLSADERSAFVAAARRPSAPLSTPSTASPREARRTNLPHPPNALIGRERDVEALCRLLLDDHARLVTVTGVGGAGKTRLALAVATAVASEFPEGVWLVELAPVSDAALVPMAVATALGVRESGGVSVVDALLAFLGQRAALLVLDNCEHLIEASAQLAEYLLATCADLRILATSREALQLAGEHRYRVQPLAVPDPDDRAAPAELARSPAVALFVARAHAVEAGFELTVESAATIAQICTQLAGIPLALELAAARVGVLSVEQIRDRLDDCFRLLVGSGRTAPTRQRTLRATLDWSYELLTDAERTVFRRMAVFAGGCELEAAEAVCGNDVLDVLSGLVDKSLVLVDAGATAARYRLLEPIRQYARQQLESSGEAGTAQAGHAAYYTELAEHAEPEIRGRGQIAWLERLDREQDNLRGALAWGLEDAGPVDLGRLELGARMVGAMVSFWYNRSQFSEGRRWTETALPRFVALPARVRARATMALANMLQGQGEHARCGALCQEAVALFRQAGDRQGAAFTLGLQGLCALYEADYEQAWELSEASLAEFRSLDDVRGLGWSLGNLGRVALARGERQRALELLEESHQLKLQAGDSFIIAVGLPYLGGLLYDLGDHSRAAVILEEGLARAREVGSTQLVAACLRQMARVARAQGDQDRALALYAEGLKLHAETDGRLSTAACLEGFAGVSTLGRSGDPPGRSPTQHDLVRAARLFGAAEALRETSRATLSPVERAEYDRDVAAVRARLDPHLFEASWAEGRSTPLERVVEEALVIADEPATPANDRHLPITRRERDVARLIAGGLTDRQIADELTITVSTVGVHVHHILAKLGLRSRWQIADWSVTHDPVELRAAEK